MGIIENRKHQFFKLRTSFMKKTTVKFFLASFLLLGVCGCTQKSQDNNAATSQTTEFFKEVDNAVVFQENSAEMQNDLVVTDVEGESISSDNVPGAEDLVNGSADLNVPEKPTMSQIQEALKNANLYQGKVDGVTGPKTRKAIEDFQAQHGLKVDGKVGPKTWQKLGQYLVSTAVTSAPQETDSYDSVVGQESSVEQGAIGD